MSRAEQLIARAQDAKAATIDAEVEAHSARPDDIPVDTWNLIQENGRVATERLHDLLTGPKFSRMRVSDQAKLIALAQNRAYGMPKTNNAASAANRKRGGAMDVTATELRAMASRAALPEYRQGAGMEDVEDAIILNS